MGAHTVNCLFLTRTPFHAFLAERIARQEALSGFDLVHVCTHATRKDEFYFLQLTRQARNGLFFRHLGSRASGYVNAIRAYPKWLRGGGALRSGLRLGIPCVVFQGSDGEGG